MAVSDLNSSHGSIHHFIPNTHSLSLIHFFVSKVKVADNNIILRNIMYLRKYFDNVKPFQFY